MHGNKYLCPTLGPLYAEIVKFRFQIVFTDVSTGVNASYLPVAAMKTYPTADTGFVSPQQETKVRQML